MGNQGSTVISVRVSQPVKEKLEAESELNSISLNTLITQVLTKHVEWDRFAEDVGFVFITRQFLRALMDHIDDKTMSTIAVSTCRGAMRDAIIFIKGQINIDTFIQTLDQWLGASHIPFRHITNNGMDRYVVQHDLGTKWSTYFATVVNALLNEIGHRTANQVTNEQSVSFEVAKANKGY